MSARFPPTDCVLLAKSIARDERLKFDLIKEIDDREAGLPTVQFHLETSSGMSVLTHASTQVTQSLIG